MNEGVGKSEAVGAGRTENPAAMPKGQRNAAATDRHAMTRVDDLDRLLERLTPEAFPEPVDYGRPEGREVW